MQFLERAAIFRRIEGICSTWPVFGTQNGAIPLAREVRNPAQRSLGLLDAVVERNAYGRQIDSSILFSESKLPGGKLEMVFIRAPRIVETGPEVEVLAQRDGMATLVRQGKLMAATLFHPELTSDRRVHKAFVDLVQANLQPRHIAQPRCDRIHSASYPVRGGCVQRLERFRSDIVASGC